MEHVNFVLTKNSLYAYNADLYREELYKLVCFRSNPVFYCSQYLMFIDSSE